MPTMDPLPVTVYRPSQGQINVIWFQVWTHTRLPFTGPDSVPNQRLLYNTWPRDCWPDPVQRRMGYDMSITQRYHPWYVGQFGVPHVWVSVVSTQMKHPASSTHLYTAFISIFQYSKGAFDYSLGQFRVSAYILIEKNSWPDLFKIGHMIYKWQP